jgi:hypothetical protein
LASSVLTQIDVALVTVLSVFAVGTSGASGYTCAGCDARV